MREGLQASLGSAQGKKDRESRRSGGLWREEMLTRFTAMVQIFAESSRIDRVERALSKLDNLEALFEVTGEFDIVALISAADYAEFHEVLRNKIRNIEGVKATAISVVLKDVRTAAPESSFEESINSDMLQEVCPA